MLLNKVTINYKVPVQPTIIFANYDENQQSNTALINMFANILNSDDPKNKSDKFLVFNMNYQNFIFNKDEILSIQVDVIEQPDDSESKNITEDIDVKASEEENISEKTEDVTE